MVLKTTFLSDFCFCVAIDTLSGCVCCEHGIVSIIPAMKASSKHCQDLNKQLAMYRAFRNIHGAAAVTRQLQLAVCPINS